MAALEDIGPVYTKSTAELTPHHHNTLHIFTCILAAEIILSSSVVVNQEVLSFFHFFLKALKTTFLLRLSTDQGGKHNCVAVLFHMRLLHV